jgi:hypothetical protein
MADWGNFSDAQAAAQKRCDIATAKLGVAEELRHWIAVPCALVVYLKYDSWISAVAAGVAAFFLVTRWYEKEYDAARDAYDRLMGMGSYYNQSKSNDAG